MTTNLAWLTRGWVVLSMVTVVSMVASVR